MSSEPQPWYRSNRGWYVTLGGKQIPLGNDRDAAFKQYHKVMAEGRPEPPPPPASADTVLAVCELFLDHVERHRSPHTFRWYRDRLQAFLDHAPKGILVSELKPFHVQRWVDGMPHKSGTKRNYVRAIKRAMHWAEQQEVILRSPIAHLPKPRGGRRDNAIPPADHEKILSLTRDDSFKDLCHFCYLTGARCAETLAVEARHLDLKNHRVVFPVEEEKMERMPRIIYLPEEAEAILRKLALRYPKGKLFKNTRGNDWLPDATNCRFRTLAKKIGRKYCLTDYRHGLATRMLAAGTDALTVSIVLGHADPSMLARVYQHINHEHGYLLEAVRKASRASA